MMSKHWKGLFIKDVLQITGKDDVFSVCWDVANKWVDEIPIKEGDTIGAGFEDYKVVGVELSKNLFNGKISTDIGVVVRVIKPDEAIKSMRGSYTPINDGCGIVGYYYVCPECKHETEFINCDSGCEKCGFSEPFVDPDRWYELKMSLNDSGVTPTPDSSG